VNGIATDPTGYTVEMAFIAPSAEPASGDWQAGTWETDGSGTGAQYYALCEVGPGTLTTFVAGASYAAWIRVTGSPDIPVRQFDTIYVTA
jgi:hypothetical protein